MGWSPTTIHGFVRCHISASVQLPIRSESLLVHPGNPAMVVRVPGLRIFLARSAQSLWVQSSLGIDVKEGTGGGGLDVRWHVVRAVGGGRMGLMGLSG
jgi:hypothetical protein